jgi:hypothetical protein
MGRLAVVMILFSIPAIDWLTPGVCPEDFQGMAPLAMIERDDAPPDAAPFGCLRPPPDSRPSQGPLEDECFCCCQHVVPQPGFAPPHQARSVKVALGPFEIVVSPTGDPPDHPPRFS